MTTYYVGPGGNDGNSGLTWALRKLTLNGAEDIPVVAGDEVIVGPGIYREQLTCDVSGSSGNVIHYRGDPSGLETDGVGGPVRITGSNNDETGTRTYCVYASAKDYREFSNFYFDLATSRNVYFINCDEISLHDCFFGGQDKNGGGIDLRLYSVDNFNISRNIFYNAYNAITIQGTVTEGQTRIVENNIIFVYPGTGRAIYLTVGGVYIRNNTIFDCGYWGTIRSDGNGASYPNYAYNNIVVHPEDGYAVFWATTSGELIEDYNLVSPPSTLARTNVSIGSNSLDYFPGFEIPLLFNGIRLSDICSYALGEFSKVKQTTDDGNGPSDDIFGRQRPSINGNRSWGAIQYDACEKETTITYNSSQASMKIIDAGSHMVRIPVAPGSSVSLSVRVYRGSDYSGTLPQMIVHQPGESSRTTTDTGSSETWNLLSDSWSAGSDTSYLFVELRSNNAASSGDFAVYFDALEVEIQ